MGGYLRSILLPHLSESQAWLEFVDALEDVSTNSESLHFNEVMGSDLLTAIIFYLFPGGLPPTLDRDFKTDTALFPHKFTESPATVLAQAMRLNLKDFKIKYTFKSGFEYTGTSQQYLRDVVNLTSLIASDGNFHYFSYISTIKEIVPAKHYLLDSDNNIVQIHGISKDYIQLPVSVGLDNVGTDFYYGLLKTDNPILTDNTGKALLSQLAYLSTSSPTLIDEFLRRTIPARCKVDRGVDFVIEDTLQLTDDYILDNTPWIKLGTMSNGTFTESNIINLQFYPTATAFIHKAFANGKVCPEGASRIYVGVSGITVPDNVPQITPLLINENPPLDISIIPTQEVTGSNEDLVYLRFTLNELYEGDAFDIPCLAELKGIDGKYYYYNFKIRVAAYDPHLVVIHLVDTLPTLHDTFIPVERSNTHITVDICDSLPTLHDAEDLEYFDVSDIQIQATSEGLESLAVGVEVFEAYILFTILNSNYNMAIIASDFSVTGLPAGLVAGNPTRFSETIVKVPITGTPTTAASPGSTPSVPSTVDAANVLGATESVSVTNQISNLAVMKGNGAAVSEPEDMTVISAFSILVDAVTVSTSPVDTGQVAEYALSTSNTTPPTSGWQEDLLFEGLQPSTSYYVWARSKENANYNAGSPKKSSFTKTTLTAPYIIATSENLNALKVGQSVSGAKVLFTLYNSTYN